MDALVCLHHLFQWVEVINFITLYTIKKLGNPPWRSNKVFILTFNKTYLFIYWLFLYYWYQRTNALISICHFVDTFILGDHSTPDYACWILLVFVLKKWSCISVCCFILKIFTGSVVLWEMAVHWSSVRRLCRCLNHIKSYIYPYFSGW